ncbi:MAG: STAS domain-containing protein [Planctomycetota bacterium]
MVDRQLEHVLNTDPDEAGRRWRIDRGPDWLFVRIDASEETIDGLADRLWSLLDQHFIYRLVLEMDEVDFLPSRMMGQLIMLQKRVMQHDGALRLCGVSPGCAEALHICRLDRALPSYRSRVDAVQGHLVGA